LRVDTLHLTHEQLVCELSKRLGLIPIDIKDERVVWFDIGDSPLNKSKFYYSTNDLLSNRDQAELFTTDVKALSSEAVLDNTIYPTGFILHMGRCGSTLLAKALAQSCRNIVITEAPPCDKIWKQFTSNWLYYPKATIEQLTVYRNLILAMGRKRIAEQGAYFVKFTSYNILFVDFIKSSFPDVPCLFLYRDPMEVLVSWLWHPPPWLKSKESKLGAFTAGCPIGKMERISNLTYFELFSVQLLKSALNISVEDLAYLNYEYLTPRHYANILFNAFKYTASSNELAVMKPEFRFYSKDDSRTIVFSSDKIRKQQAVTPEIRRCYEQSLIGLYNELECSERNLARKLLL
jgi:hypothetical protein